MFIGRKILLQITGFTVILAVWHFAGNIRASPALPPPLSVLRTLFRLILDGVYTEHISASLTIILLGIGIAVLLGFSLGTLMYRYNSFKVAALPVIESIRGVAALTLFPLLIVLFGIGTFSRVFVILWTAWPEVTLSTLNSLDVDRTVVEAAASFGASKWRIMFAIRIPMAASGILTGIRIGVGGGWIGLIAAEMLGATRGLGYFLLWSAQSFQFERVYATIIVIAVIGGLMNMILLQAQRTVTKIIGVV